MSSKKKSKQSKKEPKPRTGGQELSQEELGHVTGGAVNAFVTFYDKADGESIQTTVKNVKK